MKRHVGWFVGALFAAPLALPAQTPAPAGTQPARAEGAKAAKPFVYDEKADARQQVQEAVAVAKRDNKRVLIQWGANWCGWCKWLAEKMHGDPELKQKLKAEYLVVHVDVGQFDKHRDLAKELGAEFTAIPFLTIVDGAGKGVVQQNTEPFETKIDGKNGHDSKLLLEFLTKHQAVRLDATAVLAAGMAKAKREGKRAFVHFGAPWCGWCHRLEAWLAQPEVAALMQRDFVDVKIDTERMNGGQQMLDDQTSAAKTKSGGIPWFEFLDADGKVLAHSTGPKGNAGFPYEPAEIEHFATMLKAAKQKLTEADIEMLCRSLRDFRSALEAKKAKPASPAPAAGTPPRARDAERRAVSSGTRRRRPVR